jgi:hypothetical protein
MEGITASGKYPIDEAYAIMLTNDSGYWTISAQSGTQRPHVDEDFHIHDGATITGPLQWKPEASAGTRHNREDAIRISGTYTIVWHDYVPVDNCLFRYTIVKVLNKNVQS